MFLKCYPICKCGHIFYDLEISENIEDTAKNIMIPHYVIEPNKCPTCGEKIEGIQWPLKNEGAIT